VSATTKVNVVPSAAGSNNQLPNVPNLDAAFSLSGVNDFNSAAINSYLNFRDYLGIVSLRGTPDSNLSYQITYAAHSITQSFRPDNDGELIFQGVASNASHADADNTLQGDLTYRNGHHTLGTGFYLGEYHVRAGDTSLVFPVDTSGNQTSGTPEPPHGTQPARPREPDPPVRRNRHLPVLLRPPLHRPEHPALLFGEDR